MPARVHIYGQGPRSRALCAALVRSALPGAAIAEFAGAPAALAAAGSLPGRTILLDARCAPEAAALRAFSAGGARAAAARGFDGAERRTDAAVAIEREPQGGDGPRPVVGDWLDDPEPAARAVSGEDVEIHSPGFGFGGYASAARNTIVGLDRAGVRIAWRQFYPEREAEIDPEDRALVERFARADFRASRSLLIQPPTHLTGQLFLERYVDAYAVLPYACYTMFETDAVPARWPALLARAGRVWVPSRFNVETFAAAGVPAESIEYIPLGLEVERFVLDGERLDVAGRRGFAFLSVFGFTSRKGWDVLIEAWARAFGADEDVSLVLRTSAPNVDVRAEIARVMAERGIDPARIAPVVVIEQGLSSQALAGLYRSADAFVLPSRGEGVGLPYLEAMAFGLPTLGTAWSGATEFLDATTGYPIDYRLELVDRMTARTFPILRDQHWAEPSVESTACALRAVFDDRAAAAERAARGCAVARVRYNRTRTGRIAAQALGRIAPRPKRTFAAATVAVRGEFFSTGSRGARARALLAALESAGVAVAAVAEGADERPALFLEDARLLKAALGRDASGLPALASDAAIPEPIDTERWTPQLGGLAGFGAATTVRFLATAHLDERSGYDRAIGAFLTAFEPGEDVLLAIKVPVPAVDPAQAQALVAAAAQRHAPHRGADLGRYRISVLAAIVPEADYMQMLGSFDAFVHVPDPGGSARALLEAMATGLPCVVARAAGGGVDLSETTAYVCGEGVAAIAAAMRAIAADLPEAARRGHAARRAVVAAHGLPVAGAHARAIAEAQAGRDLTAPRVAAPETRLGIVFDLRGCDEDVRARTAALTRNAFRDAVLTDGGITLGEAARALAGCTHVAYLRGDASVTQSWDVVLADALDSRPLVRLAVPRIPGAPAPQGFARPEQSLAELARGLTVTQVGRGTPPASIVTTCLMFDGPAFAGSLQAGAQRTIEEVARDVAGGGRAAWCAFDAVVDRLGERPWPAVALV